jgi:sugar lactone lactonase YvrE
MNLAFGKITSALNDPNIVASCGQLRCNAVNSPSRQDTFNRPSDVVVGMDGDIFIADGHGAKSNARIVKFNKDGKFIKTWGREGSAPGEFDVPHGLAIDRQGRLFVADRSNNRIQIFDQDGKFIDAWTQFGRPSGLFIDHQDTLYVARLAVGRKI